MMCAVPQPESEELNHEAAHPRHHAAGDATTPDGTTAVFHLDGGLMLSIYPRSELAKDAAVALTAAKPGEFSVGHVVATRAEVDEVIEQAKAAGATVAEAPRDRPWGI
jgi:uncharacterized protein